MAADHGSRHDLALNEGLIRLCDKARADSARAALRSGASGPEKADVESVLAQVRRSAFEAVYAAAQPPLGSGSVWVFERCIIWLQVRACCSPCTCVIWPDAVSVPLVT